MRRQGSGGGEEYLFVACLSYLTIDHASVSRRSGEKGQKQVYRLTAANYYHYIPKYRHRLIQQLVHNQCLCNGTES